MEYLSISQVAEKWGIKQRRIRRLCEEGYLVLTRWEHTGLFLLMLRNQKMNASNLGSIFKKNQ